MNKIDKPNPLQALIRSATALPVSTGDVAHYQRRIESGGTVQVVLADTSSSMAGSAGSRTKIDVLREALQTVPPSAYMIAFSTQPMRIESAAALPSPCGGTALHLALDMAATLIPARTLVISDGQPDGEQEALASAARLPGTIDVIYCGPDSDARARDFLMRLARAGGGRYAAHDLRRASAQLGPAIRALLATGKP